MNMYWKLVLGLIVDMTCGEKTFKTSIYNYKYIDTNKRTDYNCNLTIIAIIVDSLTSQQIFIWNVNW